MQFYRLDANDRVTEVGREWDRFARLNGGPQAVAERVVGQPLHLFMAGDPTRQFVQAAIHAARTLNAERTLPYRCDGPDERRWFRMRIVPEAGGAVRIEHELVRSEPRPPRAARFAAGKAWRCSQCLALRPVSGAAWLDPDTPGLECIGDDVCPACTARLFDASAAR